VGGSFILYGDDVAMECSGPADCMAIQKTVGGKVA
jgi:hypothetical protein